MNHYHQTTYTTGKALAEYEVQASKQDSQVLEFMAHNRRLGFTAEDISDLVLWNAPLTSARRALSNLYKDGRILKVGEVNGHFGRPITIWQYKVKSPGKPGL